jgi:hypothetical protein
MKYWTVIVSKLPANGIALYPFILLKDRKSKNDAIIINHEKIHLAQQLELIILPFYLLYFIHYLINLIRYQNHDKAYRQIVFEKEAYQHDEDLSYLASRKSYSWIRLFA